MLDRHEEMCRLMRRSGKFEPPEMRRASGAIVCRVCGYEYRDHPQHIPFNHLVVLCNGEHVHL